MTNLDPTAAMDEARTDAVSRVPVYFKMNGFWQRCREASVFTVIENKALPIVGKGHLGL